MRARGRVSVCNEMKVAIDKVAGANEQTEGEVRGWLMETRPKMGEKNCTRAVKRGRRLCTVWPAAEVQNLHAAREASKASRQASRQGEPTDGERGAYEKDTSPGSTAIGWPSVRVITRCRRIVTLPDRCMRLHHIRRADDSDTSCPGRALIVASSRLHA